MTKERAILFSAPMVRAILEGQKTQTRRIVKKAPWLSDEIMNIPGTPYWTDGTGWDSCVNCPYGKPGDLLMCYLCAHEHYTTTRITSDTSIAERRLHGRGGRTDIQPNEIRGLWTQGDYRLVCAEGTHKQQGLSDGKSMSREQEGDKGSASAGLHGVPWNAEAGAGDAAPQWQQGRQQAGEPLLGNGSGELARQADTRNLNNGGAPPCGQVHEQGAGAHFLGGETWAMQSEAGGACAGCGAVVDTRYRVGGDVLWVREEHYRYGHWEAIPGVLTKGGRQKWKFVSDTEEVLYDAPELFRKGRHHKDPHTPAWHKRLARFMPRWASRITLEVTGVRVERLHDISEEDAKAEGATGDCPIGYIPAYQAGPHSYHFAQIWESINGPGSWEANPFVWVVTFKRVKP